MPLPRLFALFLLASWGIAQTPVKEARYLPCRVDTLTTLIFPKATKVVNAASTNEGVLVEFNSGDRIVQVKSKAASEGSRLVVTTAEGSTYTYEIHHEILNGKDCGAINFSVWPLTDDQIMKSFEPEIIAAINSAPVKQYNIHYSKRKPSFSIQPTVGFDGKRSAFQVESLLNAAVMIYTGTKSEHLPTQTVPLKFNPKVWVSDRVSEHWFVRHEDEWATIDVQ